MKYEILTNDYIKLRSTKLYRIKAVKDFSNVRKGDLGGYIEKEDNLSHNGNAWVYDNARVYNDAMVCGNAIVCDDAMVCDYSRVGGNAIVYNNARVYNDAMVCDNAWVCGNVWVYGNAMVCDDARLYDNSRVGGNAIVYGNARVCNNAMVYMENHIITISNLGSRNSTITFYNTIDGIGVTCGCFSGTVEEFKEKVKKVHSGSKYELIYLKAIEIAKLQIIGYKERSENV